MPKRRTGMSGLRTSIGLLSAFIMALILVGLFSGAVYAQSAPETTPQAEQQSQAPTTQSAEPSSTQSSTLTDKAQAVQTQLAGQVNQALDEDGEGSDQNLDSQQIQQLKGIEEGTISPELLAQIKAKAVEKIQQYGPIALEKLDAKSKKKQDGRLFWVAILVIGVVPLATLLVFLVYPFIARSKINKRVSGVSLGRIYKLYLPQAFLVTLVLVLLGSALFGVQFLTGRVLGGVTNPQLVLQREALNYVIDDSEYLIDNYTDIVVGIADDLANEDPEKPIFDVVLENALQLKENAVVRTADSIVRFVMPFLSYLSLVSYVILLVFFLLRIRPDVALMLTYPVEALVAEQEGKPLPEFISSAAGVIEPGATTNQTTIRVGRKLVWNEIKVISLFALGILATAVVMSFVLALFFSQMSVLLVQTINEAAEYFLRAEDAANTLILTTAILMVFVIECVAVFLLGFTFALGKLQDVLRHRFGNRVTWKQTGKFMSKVGMRFGWLMLLLGILAMGLPFLADKAQDALYNNVKEPSWTLILIAVPATLLVGLNLGLWLLRGFRMIKALLTKSAAAEFGLKKATVSQPELAGAKA